MCGDHGYSRASRYRSVQDRTHRIAPHRTALHRIDVSTGRHTHSNPQTASTTSTPGNHGVCWNMHACLHALFLVRSSISISLSQQNHTTPHTETEWCDGWNDGSFSASPLWPTQQTHNVGRNTAAATSTITIFTKSSNFRATMWCDGTSLSIKSCSVSGMYIYIYIYIYISTAPNRTAPKEIVMHCTVTSHCTMKFCHIFVWLWIYDTAQKRHQKEEQQRHNYYSQLEHINLASRGARKMKN